MSIFLNSLLSKSPVANVNGVPFFGNDGDGDCFDENDISMWAKKGFDQNWGTRYFIDNPASLYLLREIICNHNYVIDLACGPGMGLLPSIKQLNPDFPCIATDANPSVVSEWKKYIDQNVKISNRE